MDCCSYCYKYQGELCYPTTPASTSNEKFLAPSNPVYYRPFTEYVYPIQKYKYVSPGMRDYVEYLRKKENGEGGKPK